MNNTIGMNISNLRKSKGFTQDELAEKLGVSPKLSPNGKTISRVQILCFYLS